MKTLTCSKCNRETTTLHHVHGHPGEYCIQCKPVAEPQFDPFVESVNGIVIGPMLSRYEFWTNDNQDRIALCWKETDAKAEQWFHETYPNEYDAGANMRCYD